MNNGRGEVNIFHPRVREWLRRQGYKNIRHEPRIGRKEPDFVVNYNDWHAIVECKMMCNRSQLGLAITQVNRYLNEIDYLLARPYHYNHYTAKEYANTWVICCLAIDTFVGISFSDAFALCADKGVLLLNPGYSYTDSKRRWLRSHYPYVATQLPLFGKEQSA